LRDLNSGLRHFPSRWHRTHFGDVLEHCERHRIGFIPWFPLAAGKLSAPGGPISRLVTEHKATPFQLALAWLLWRSPAMLPISGTSQVPHLEEDLAAASVKLHDAEWNSLNLSTAAD